MTVLSRLKLGSRMVEGEPLLSRLGPLIIGGGATSSSSELGGGGDVGRGGGDGVSTLKKSK